MNYKIFDGNYWVRKELCYFGSQASFDELKREIARIDKDVESGLIIDAELVLEEERFSKSDRQYAYLYGLVMASHDQIEQIKASEEKANRRRSEYEKAEFERLKAKFEKT